MILPIKKKYRLEILLHLIFWLAIFYTENALTSLSERYQQNVNGVITERIIIRSTYPLSFFTLALLMAFFYINIFWLFKRILKYKSALNRVVVVAVWTAIVFFTNYFIIHILLRFTRINPFEWRHLQFAVLLIFLFVLGLSIAYFFLKAWISNELLREKLEANQLSTEIKFLKSQINPHFLFNTLNNLFSMAQDKGNDELADGISKLSGMMRYMIYESNAERVPLRNEIEYLKNCIALNKLRYANSEADVSFTYPDKADNEFIAPMLFIPFVENAFKHGVLIGRPSKIDIGIAITDKQVLFSCANKNYSFIKRLDDNSGGIGLENVKRRLELVYPDKYELAINSDENEYAVVLKIDLR
jgi:two-component system LytT family sensor kinase